MNMNVMFCIFIDTDGDKNDLDLSQLFHHTSLREAASKIRYNDYLLIFKRLFTDVSLSLRSQKGFLC